LSHHLWIVLIYSNVFLSSIFIYFYTKDLLNWLLISQVIEILCSAGGIIAQDDVVIGGSWQQTTTITVDWHLKVFDLLQLAQIKTASAQGNGQLAAATFWANMG